MKSDGDVIVNKNWKHSTTVILIIIWKMKLQINWFSKIKLDMGNIYSNNNNNNKGAEIPGD